MPERPVILSPRREGIPRTLRQRDQWVLWCLERRGARWTKIPKQAGGTNASSTDPATWASFEAAWRAYEGGQFDGIGFVFARDGGVFGIDLDKCRDPDAATLEPWAQITVERFATYAELSPSGRGVHVFALGLLPAKGRRKGQIEVYEDGRYFTVTGHLVPGRPMEVAECGDEVERWHAEVFKGGAVRSTPSDMRLDAPAATSAEADDDLIAKMRGARNGQKFIRLFDEGSTNGYGSASEADLALCSILAFWTRGDAGRVDRLFRRSALMRAKWDATNGHGTYGSRTIATALTPRTRGVVPAEEDVRAHRTDSRTPGVELCTDMGNARRLARHHGQSLRFTLLDGWIAWDGRRWKRDDIGLVMRRAKATVRAIYDEAKAAAGTPAAQDLATWAVRSQKRDRLIAMVELAKSEPEIAAHRDDFDRNPWLFNVTNGTLDLSTGTLHEHRREDLITRLAPVAFDSSATAPTFDRFLARILPDQGVRDYVQRRSGSALTGDASDQSFDLAFGLGRNGKSTYYETLAAVLGEYAVVTPFSTLTTKRDESSATPDLADLAGARLVIASEPPQGARLNTAIVKQLTGGDTIRARRLYKEHFSFVPQFKIVLIVNHKPQIAETTHAIWERVCLVPFSVRIPRAERDRGLKGRLRGELAGILAWLVRGCMAWKQSGLAPPEAVQAATDSYRREEDAFGEFLDLRCVLGDACQASASDLLEAYSDWAKANGEEALTAKALGSRLSDLELRNRKRHGVKWWIGIGLRASLDGSGDDGDDGDEDPGNPPHERCLGGVPETRSPSSPSSPGPQCRPGAEG